MTTTKRHNSRSVPQQTEEEKASCWSNEDQYHLIIMNHTDDLNVPITSSHGATYDVQPFDTIA